MGISGSQLETWAHPGAMDTAKSTHESIRYALNQYAGWPSTIDYEVYLQGSYKNDTNIRGDSDVDVVVELKSASRTDVSALTPYEELLYQQHFSDATYDWADFRRDVVAALRRYYGLAAVQEGKKVLKLARTPGRLPADVVVCMQYRKYQHFWGLSAQGYTEGMIFFVPSEGRWVVNYPKLHYDQGVAKNSLLATNGLYKPTVRMFKNARSYLIDRHFLTSDYAPSYFVECLFHNVPDAMFGGDYQQTFFNVVAWLNRTAIDHFTCQNGQLPLFGTSPEQWSVPAARTFLQALSTLWDNW